MSEPIDSPRDGLTPGNPKPTGELCQHCWDSHRYPSKVFYLFTGGTGCTVGHKSPVTFRPQTAEQARIVDQGFEMYYAEEQRLKGGE